MNMPSHKNKAKQSNKLTQWICNPNHQKVITLFILFTSPTTSTTHDNFTKNVVKHSTTEYNYRIIGNNNTQNLKGGRNMSDNRFARKSVRASIKVSNTKNVPFDFSSPRYHDLPLATTQSNNKFSVPVKATIKIQKNKYTS